MREMIHNQQLVTVVCVNGDEDAEYVVRHPDCAKAVEWRMDNALTPKAVAAMEWLRTIGKPVVLTPRSRYEGGARPDWTFADRKDAFRKYLHLASAIDIEACDAPFFTDVIEEAEAAGILAIVSYHSLRRFPEPKEIEFAFQGFRLFRGDIFKLAVRVDTLKQMRALTRLVREFNAEAPGAIAAMATGDPHGKRSRMRYAYMGWTNLVYCFATGSIVPGQYQIEEFNADFARLVA